MRLILPAVFFIWSFAHAQAPIVSPWRFGMTKSEVIAYDKFGPYKDVKATGGTETFNALFNGKKANVSFVFDEKGLYRIQVWAYEGRDKEEAGKAWAALYTYMKENFGSIEVPQIKADPAGDPITPEVLSIAATMHVATLGKVQMAPEKMPKEFKVFSSFMSREVKDAPYFYLFLLCDRP